MKKLKFAFHIALLAVCLMSGLSGYSQGTGTIYGELPEVNEMISVFSTAYVDTNVLSYGITPRKSHFSIPINLHSKYRLVLLEHDVDYAEIVLAPGSNLEIDITALKNNKGNICKGYGDEIANFAAQHAWDMSLLDYYPRYAYRICEDNPSDYLKALNSQYKKEVKYFKRHGKGLDTSFRYFWFTYLRYARYVNLLTYPKFHQQRAKLSSNLKEIPTDLLAIIDSVPETYDDSLLECKPYQEYIKTIMPIKTALEYRRAGKDYPADSVGFIKQQIIARMPPRSAAYVIGFSVSNSIGIGSIEKAEALLNEYKKLFPGNENIYGFEKRLAEQKERVKGK